MNLIKRTFYLMQRELSGYFASPIAYVIIGVFLIFSGFLFNAYLAPSGGTTSPDSVQILSGFLGTTVFILLFLGPLLTTRLIAEENRTGTLELLVTSPVRDVEIVIGKFLASMVLIIITFALTLVYVLLLLIAKAQIDWSTLGVGYLGVLLACGLFFSIGLFASSLTSSQVIAAVIAIVTTLLFWVPSLIVTDPNGNLSGLVRYVSIQQRIDDFTKGVVDLRYVVYFLSLIVFFLFLTVQALGSRRWRAA